jgi:hypothetical protein
MIFAIFEQFRGSVRKAGKRAQTDSEDPLAKIEELWYGQKGLGDAKTLSISGLIASILVVNSIPV